MAKYYAGIDADGSVFKVITHEVYEGLGNQQDFKPINDDFLATELALYNADGVRQYEYSNGVLILRNASDIQAAANEQEKDVIRSRRYSECFLVLARYSPFYYKALEISDPDKYAELNAWYQAWLDAPETLIIPTQPEWLK